MRARYHFWEPCEGDKMSRDGHGFELPVDPRVMTRKAAAAAQRESDAARIASEPEKARSLRERLAADEDETIERALTAARRARS